MDIYSVNRCLFLELLNYVHCKGALWQPIELHTLVFQASEWLWQLWEVRQKLCKIGHHLQESLQRSDVLSLRHLQYGLNLLRLRPLALRSEKVTHELHTWLVLFHFGTIQLQVPDGRHIFERSALMSFESVVYLMDTTAKSGNQEVICYHFHFFQILHKLVHGALPHFR